MGTGVGIGRRETDTSRGRIVSFDRGSRETTGPVGQGCSLGLPFPLLCRESQV